jgi:hypothetical protein
VKIAHLTGGRMNLTTIDERRAPFDEHEFLTRKQLHATRVDRRYRLELNKNKTGTKRVDADTYSEA